MITAIISAAVSGVVGYVIKAYVAQKALSEAQGAANMYKQAHAWLLGEFTKVKTGW